MSATLLQSELLAAVPGIAHGFTTRQGGESKGAFASLNLSPRVGDERAAIEHNRALVLAALGRPEAAWVTLKQVHGENVIEVMRQAGKSIEADGLWTRDRAAAVAVLVADCVPILMASEDGAAVAAVHAGWRGTVAKIATRMVERLASAGTAPARLKVALGPAIGPCCFDVNDDVVTAIRQAFPASGEALKKREDGRMVADLWALNRMALIAAGVPEQNLEELRTCTACNPDEFFSHRRDEGKTGRQAGVIAPRR